MTPGTGACDHHAFETFLDQEFWKHTPIAIRGDDGVMSVALGGEQHSFEHIIYAFFRCELAHEGQLPVSVTFEGDPTSLELFVRGGDAGSPFVLSRSHLDLFIRTVTAAPENADQFPTRVVHLLQALATSQACSAATTAAAQGTTVEEVERVFGDFSVAGLCRHDEGAHTWIFTPGDAQTPLQLIEKARAAGLDLQRCLARASG